MQQFQSYYPQMQQQPMMFNNMQQFNPYAERIAQLQAQQQQMQSNQNFVPLGKMVENVDVLKTLEVPMDGQSYFFPKADGSEIYSKRWLPNGTTSTTVFKPILETEGNNGIDRNVKIDSEALEKVLEGIQSDIQTINSKIDKISKPITSTRGKKEVAENEDA